MLRSLLVVVIPSFVVLSLGSLTACAPPAPEVATYSTLSMPLGGPCTADASGGADFKSESDKMKITVSGNDIPTPVTAEGDVGELTIEEVPEGSARTIGVFGLVNGRAQWRAVARGVTVKKDEDTKVDVLMARIADVTCGRSPDPSARAFHSATPLGDGRVLFVGGAESVAPNPGAGPQQCATCQKYTASSTASIYEPKTGTIKAVGQMSVPRMAHTATLLDDGRVVIAGGARELIARASDADHPFPLEPGSGTVLGSVEVFDPDSESFTPVADSSCSGCEPRMFAAAAATRTGGMIVTGGIPSADTPNNLSNALTTTTTCTGNPLACVAGPPMARARAGHTAFRLDPDGVYLMGGAVDTSAVGTLPGFQLERWDGGVAFTLISVAAMTVDRNVFFAANVQYVPFRVLVAGGLRRDAAGQFRPATVDAGGFTVGQVILYDATYGTQGGIVTGNPGADPMHLQSPRWLGAGAALPGNSRAVFAGGFEGIDLTPNADVDMFDEASVTVSPVSIGGQARTLREPRGALSAAAIGDGTVVFSGGTATTDSPLATVEVFADPKTPAGVAE